MNKLISPVLDSFFGSMSRPTDRLFYAAVAAISLGTGLVNAFSTAHDAARRGGVYDLKTPLLWEMTSILVIILLGPMLLAAVRALRSSPASAVRIAIALAAIAAFSALHIAGMVGLRKLLLWAADGSYDFQLSLATLAYELRKDVMTAVVIGAAAWLFDGYGSAAGKTSPPRETAPTALWLRDGAHRVRISPTDILWISSAGNYVEYGLADGSQRLIRGTLSAAEAELARFAMVRIHRSRLVNLARVTAVSVRPSGDFDLTFDTGHAVQGSRRFRSAVVTLEQASGLR